MSDLLEIQEEFLNANAQCTELLERWSRTASPASADAVELARRKYQRLHVAMLQTLSDAAALEGRVTQLTANLKSIQVQQELVEAAADGARDGGNFQDAVEILDRFREDRDRAAQQASESGDRAAAARLQVEALTKHRDGLSSRLTELEEERRAELAPQIKAARDEMDLLQENLRAEQLRAQTAQKEVADVVARLEALQLEIRGLGVLADEERHELGSWDKRPERCRRDADLAAQGLKTLEGEAEELDAREKELVVAEASWARQVTEVTNAQEAAARAGEKLRAAMAQKETALGEAGKEVEVARLEAERHLAEGVTLDLELEKRGTEAKRAMEALKANQRSRDVALRRLNKAEKDYKVAQGEVPPLENAFRNMTGQVAGLRKQLGAEAQSRTKLQAGVEGLVTEIAAEKNLTELQAALVKASLQDVRELDQECAEVRGEVAKRDKLAQDLASQRDAAGRQVAQSVAKLREALEAAELKDGEVEDMKSQRGIVKAQQRELRELCEIMSEQVERFRTVCQAAQACMRDLDSKVEVAQEQLRQAEATADAKGGDLRVAERERGAAGAAKALAAGRLAAAKQQRAAAQEEADCAALEAGRLRRAVEEGDEAAKRLQKSKAMAQQAKEAAQKVLLGRDDELCRLYEQSDFCQSLMDEGTRALLRCDDDIRTLQLELAELQRKLFATQKTAPDVASYDRSIAQLRADVFRARREAEQLSVVLEDPKLTPNRWRVLPGPIPSPEDLADRMGQIGEKLDMRLNQIAQKDVTLDELQRLIDSLVQKAAGSHDGAFELSVQMNECQRGLQAMTRRMMATVSELALYQALSLKYGADRDALRLGLAAARRDLAEGRPPAADADKEFARAERDRAQQAEVRAQAAELRRLQEAGLLGAPQSTAAPRPHAYLPDDGESLPRPFLAPFAPFKPSAPQLAAPAPGAGRRGGATPSPTPPRELQVAKAGG